MISFVLNDVNTQSSAHPRIPVLGYIRGIARLTGTKDACRDGDCGACAVLLGKTGKSGIVYSAVNSCLLPMGEVQGCHLVTIEGLNRSDGLTPIQQAFYDLGASQCGYCTPGMIVSLTGFFLNTTDPSLKAGMEALDGNICRCTGYQSVKRATGELCKSFSEDELKQAIDPLRRIRLLSEKRFLPDYFVDVPHMLEELQAEGSDSQEMFPRDGILVAGGTDLYVQGTEKLEHADLVLLSSRPDLNFIRVSGGVCLIGATVTVEQIRRSEILWEILPSLYEALVLVSSTPVRNRATVGGNIINASPIGDLTIIFLALGASAVLANGEEQRTVTLENFFQGYKELDIRENEILESLSFQIPEHGSRFSFEKIAKRKYMDIASVNSAMLLQEEGGLVRCIRISAGGIAPIPMFLRRTCEYLTGRKITRETIKGAAEIASGEVSPLSDVRGSAEYKTVLLKRLIYAHLLEEERV